MTWIDLDEPRPLPRPQIYSPYIWPNGASIRLAHPVHLPDISFVKAISSRRSKRTFAELADLELGNILWLTCRVQASVESGHGFMLTQRPTPSSGAIHPIHILINSPESKTWWRYDAFEHALVEVKGAESALADLRSVASELLPIELATLFFFVAEPGKTASKYKNASSLVWRDAGALLGTLALAAAALELAYCPIGLTGNRWAAKLDPKGQLAGVGLAALGSTVGET